VDGPSGRDEGGRSAPLNPLGNSAERSVLPCPAHPGWGTIWTLLRSAFRASYGSDLKIAREVEVTHRLRRGLVVTGERYWVPMKRCALGTGRRQLALPVKSNHDGACPAYVDGSHRRTNPEPRSFRQPAPACRRTIRLGGSPSDRSASLRRAGAGCARLDVACRQLREYRSDGPTLDTTR
jgi:hypothetical protein